MSIRLCDNAVPAQTVTIHLFAHCKWIHCIRAGMAANTVVAQRVKRSGMGLISPTAGLSALQNTIITGMAYRLPCTIAVALVDWHVLLNGKSSTVPKVFEEVMTEQGFPYRQSQHSMHPAVNAVQQHQATDHRGCKVVRESKHAQHPSVLSIENVQPAVEELVSSILGQRVATMLPLMEAGLDSLGAIRLRSALATKFGMELSPTVIFDYPTIYSLTQHLIACSMTQVSVNASQHKDVEAVLPHHVDYATRSRRLSGSNRGDLGYDKSVDDTTLVDFTSEVSAVVESVLGVRLSPEHALMSAGLDSLGKFSTIGHHF